jgi:hypothetical protein
MDIGSKVLIAVAATAIALGGASVQAQPKTPRNAFGQPDLSGDWSNASITPLTRNKNISDKAVLTPAEAKALEADFTQALAADDEQTNPNVTAQQSVDKFKASKLVKYRPDFASAASGGDVGGYNTFWIDPGTHLVEINGQYRTSIVTTPDGQIPRPKAGALLARPPAGISLTNYDSYENRPLGERCITFAGRNNGPPMLSNGYYNNNYSIVQTKDEVAILVELIHDVRHVRLNAQHRTDGVRPSMGDSIGHYEGDTLVVETTNLPERENFMGAWKDLKVTEWFTRQGPKKIVYRFQVEDPGVWDKPWGGEGVFNALKPGSVYEYACHEGNYALGNVLGGAREREATERRGAGASGPGPGGG